MKLTGFEHTCFQRSSVFSSTSKPVPWISGHNQCVQQFNSILILTTQSYHKPHKLKALSYKTAPTSDAGHKSWASYPSDPASCKSALPMILFSGLRICYKVSLNSGTQFTYIFQLIIKDIRKYTNEQLDKEVIQGEVLKGPNSPQSRDALPSWYMNVFNQEAL